MKKRLAAIIKRFCWIYTVYFSVFNFLLKVFSVFLKIDEKLILINSFGGKKFDDSPKILYEAMKRDARFSNYKIVWAFHNPAQFDVTPSVKTDTLAYFRIALKAKCWITNSSMERGLDFKRKETFYFNTWHGTPIKKMGTDIAEENLSFKKKGRSKVDAMTVQGDFEADIFERVFGIEACRFLKCGLPRNDVLLSYSEQEKNEIKESLGIPLGKKVILYAPTFREYQRDAWQNCILTPPIDMGKWKKEIGEEYFLLVRAHYEVAKMMDILDDDFVKNVSDYPYLNDLMMIADVLISDYSSIFFDFSVMDKAMLHFTYDYEEYSQKRGMYFDIRTELAGGEEEEEILNLIKNMNMAEHIKSTREFREKYVNYYGRACKSVLDCLIKNLADK